MPWRGKGDPFSFFRSEAKNDLGRGGRGRIFLRLFPFSKLEAEKRPLCGKGGGDETLILQSDYRVIIEMTLRPLLKHDKVPMNANCAAVEVAKRKFALVVNFLPTYQQFWSRPETNVLGANLKLVFSSYLSLGLSPLWRTPYPLLRK